MIDCYHALGPERKSVRFSLMNIRLCVEGFNLGIMSFTLANDDEYPVHRNINYLRNALWQTLVSTLIVRSMCISNIMIDRDGKDLFVTVTLLDAPPRYGPVESPLQEPSLRTSIDRLRRAIDANNLTVRTTYGRTEDVVLRARIDSLQVIYTSFDRNDTQSVHENLRIIYKSSGPLITGFWIGFALLGVFIGVLGGFLIRKRFFRPK